MSEVVPTRNLIEFKAALGYDVGTVLYLVDKFNNPTYIDPKLFAFKKFPYAEVWYNHLVWRTVRNPVECALKDQWKSSADNIYNQLMEKHEENVYMYSPLTDTMKFINTSLSGGKVWASRCTISCENEIQAKIARMISPSSEVVLNETDLANYDILYVEHYEDIAKFKNRARKIICLSEKRFNFTDEFTVKPEVMELVKESKLRIIEAYKGIRLPINMEGIINETVQNKRDQEEGTS